MNDTVQFYRTTIGRISREPYRSLRTWRNRLERDIETGWVYRHTVTTRTRPTDRLVLAWINAEMVRRIWADPLIFADAR